MCVLLLQSMMGDMDSTKTRTSFWAWHKMQGREEGRKLSLQEEWNWPLAQETESSSNPNPLLLLHIKETSLGSG